MRPQKDRLLFHRFSASSRSYPPSNKWHFVHSIHPVPSSPAPVSSFHGVYSHSTAVPHNGHGFSSNGSADMTRPPTMTVLAHLPEPGLPIRLRDDPKLPKLRSLVPGNHHKTTPRTAPPNTVEQAQRHLRLMAEEHETFVSVYCGFCPFTRLILSVYSVRLSVYSTLRCLAICIARPLLRPAHT